MQQLLDAARLGSLYALMSLGIALVFGVMRLVNFAYGELIMVGGYVLLIVSDTSWPVMAGTTVVSVCVVALLMERVAFRPVREADPTTLLVTSFALSVALRNLVTFIEGSRPKGVDVLPGLTHPVSVAGTTVPWLDIVTMIVTGVLLLGFVLFLQRTSTGLHLRAAAEDFQMARLLGVRANRVIGATFAVSGVFAAVVAVLLVAQTGTVSPAMGLGPVLIGFVATVIGGMGSLSGAALGGFTLGCLSVLLQSELPEGAKPYRDALIFAAVIGILLLRPNGLRGNPALQERV